MSQEKLSQNKKFYNKGVCFMAAHNSTHQLKALCSTCSLRELCLPVGLMPNEFFQLDAVIRQSRRLKKGEYLFRAGEPFTSLFAIRAGFFKTTVASQDGRDQVTGFFMSGELIGMDGICSHVHSCDAVALEDSEVCELPFAHMEELGQNIPSLQTHFFRLMSREIVRDQGVMLLLGNMRAEERLAAFLLNLSIVCIREVLPPMILFCACHVRKSAAIWV